MSDGDFFREVDEAVRQDQLKKLWDKYGILVLGCAIAIVAGVAGYKGWFYWQDKQAADAGARFTGALTLAEEGKTEDALAAFTDLAAQGHAGYKVLAQFQLAAAAVKAEKPDEAVKIYDRLSKDTSVDETMRGFAAVQAALLLVDKASLGEMKQRMDAMAEGTGPWRHSAREILGLTAYRVGNNAEAEKYFSQALVDPGIPANMRNRAEMMLSLVVKADAPAPAAQ